MLRSWFAVADDIFNDIISASDAWSIPDDSDGHHHEEYEDDEIRPTNSARRLRALIEQVTGASLSLIASRSYLTLP